MSTVVRTLAIIAVTLLGLAAQVAGQEEDAPTWPREFPLPDGGSLIVHQPQVERWDDFKSLQALAAIELTPAGKDATLGAIRIVSDTDTDQASRKVVLSNIKVAESSFPTADAATAAAMGKSVADVFPKGPVTVSLDRIIANLDRELVKIRSVDARNDPPQIYTSRKRNAMLVVVDGDRIYERITGTRLAIVANTASYLLRHAEFEQYYLVYGRSWITTADLSRPWEPQNNLPDTFRNIPATAQWQGIRARVPGGVVALSDVPEVFLTAPPATMIHLNGEPRFGAITGTNLQYAENSNEDLFRSTVDGMIYVLLSGRWFRSPGIDTPLEYCETLPDDFAKIPADHECGRVRPSVPGTPEAREAVIAAHIPCAVKVKRDAEPLEVSYIGPARFEPIEGTSVELAVNTSLDVLRADGAYYACHDAIWYRSDSPEGSFTVCDRVPDAVYDIPPSSPLFRVTYVYVDTATPEEVRLTYYPGYLGTFVSAGGTVVYGTGYVHRMPAEYYRHYFSHGEQHRNDHIAHHQTYGYDHYYDHLAGRFQMGQSAARTHYATTASTATVYLSWAGGGVSAVPYGVSGAAAPQSEAGTVRSDAPDLYAGPDGNVYRRDNVNWALYSAGRNWSPVDWGGRPTWTPAPRVGVEPGSWTRRPATQRGLQNHTFSRDLTAHRYMQYRQNYMANRVQ